MPAKSSPTDQSRPEPTDSAGQEAALPLSPGKGAATLADLLRLPDGDDFPELEPPRLTRDVPMTSKLPPPPEGYATWLDFVVRNYDFSLIRSDYMFDDEFGPLDTHGMRALVCAEYAALKARAGDE